MSDTTKPKCDVCFDNPNCGSGMCPACGAYPPGQCPGFGPADCDGSCSRMLPCCLEYAMCGWHNDECEGLNP